jgi:hypothetical protein
MACSMSFSFPHLALPRIKRPCSSALDLGAVDLGETTRNGHAELLALSRERLAAVSGAGRRFGAPPAEARACPGQSVRGGGVPVRGVGALGSARRLASR